MANKAGHRHFGSVRKRSSGRWQARYVVDGVVRFGPVTYETKADAQAYLATVEADLVRQSWQAPRIVVDEVGDYVDRWIAEHPRLKDSTRELYTSLNRNHIRGTSLGSVALKDLTSDRVRTWHAELRDALAKKAEQRANALAKKKREPSQATTSDGSVAAAQAYRLLRAAMTTAQEDGLMQSNPCRLKGAGVSRSSERPTATPQEVQQLAEAMPEHYRAMVHMAAWTGARLGELTALRRGDVDLSGGVMSITERLYRLKGRMDFDAPKSRASKRTVSLPPHLIPLIQAHLDEFTGAEDDALVFTTTGGRPITKSNVAQVWSRARKKAGREDMRFHDLRHTGQTLAALAGATEAELMQRMGHSTTSASRVYMHSTTDHSRAVAAALSEMAASDNVVPLRPVRRRKTASGSS